MSNSAFAVIVSCGFQPEQGSSCSSQEGPGQAWAGPCGYSVPPHIVCRERQGRAGQVAQWSEHWFHVVSAPMLIICLFCTFYY